MMSDVRQPKPSGRFLLFGYLFGHGGIQTHVHRLARALQARGHRVIVLTPPAFSREDEALPNDVTYELRIFKGWSSVFGNLGLGTDALDAAVVFGPGWRVMLGMILLRRTGRKYFFEGMSGERLKLLDSRFLTHFFADGVIAQAHDVEKAFRRAFHWRGTTAVLPAIPAVEELFMIEAARSPKPGLLRLAYFGRLVRHKNVHFLVENWDRLRHYAQSLDIHGSGPEEGALAALVREKGLQDHIRIHGGYAGGSARHRELLGECDLVLLPTLGSEGAPLVLLEAAACGVPFVANGVGGITDYRNPFCEVTEQGIKGFIPRYESLARRLLENGFEPAQLRAWYDAHFGFETLVARWEAFMLDRKA